MYDWLYKYSDITHVILQIIIVLHIHAFICGALNNIYICK